MSTAWRLDAPRVTACAPLPHEEGPLRPESLKRPRAGFRGAWTPADPAQRALDGTSLPVPRSQQRAALACIAMLPPPPLLCCSCVETPMLVGAPSWSCRHQFKAGQLAKVAQLPEQARAARGSTQAPRRSTRASSRAAASACSQNLACHSFCRMPGQQRGGAGGRMCCWGVQACRASAASACAPWAAAASGRPPRP